MSYPEQQMQNFIEAGLSEADRCYARINELEAQNAELVAKIYAIKDAWMAAGSWPDTVEEKQAIANAINAAPQQCLREVEAKAGRAGYLACLEEYVGTVHPDFHDSMADQYADRVKAGDV